MEPNIRTNFPESWLFDTIDVGNDTEYVLVKVCEREIDSLCLVVVLVMIILVFEVEPYSCKKSWIISKINNFFLIAEDELNYEEEDDEIVDRFSLESFIPEADSAKKDSTPRVIKTEDIQIRKSFPESWIFDSLFNDSSGYRKLY